MSILFEAVEPMSQVVHIFNRYDEDAVDRLNHKYSTIEFIILAIVVTTNQVSIKSGVVFFAHHRGINLVDP